ncbi:hypothetical protein ACOSZE_15510 [Lysinibacillus fusiformis]|uniref:hypothetical protein n=1 Tax=Lysinibacillus fusiformis TaxID=28031 RepID=UPI000E971588|nr:hypothetical protein [Lysinibacillus sp.]
MSELEFARYKTFTTEYFPNSPVTNSGITRKIYNVVQHNIDFMKLLDSVDSEADRERKNLYKTYYLLNLRVLYHLSSNDPFIDGVIIRAIVENLLRLATSLLKFESRNIIDLSFSDMKDALESKGFQHRYREFYENLCNYFGTYSKDVHGENVYRLSEQEFLVSIRKDKDEEHLNKLFRVYSKLNELMIPFFLKEISTKQKDLTVGNLSKILSLVGEGNYELFCSK